MTDSDDAAGVRDAVQHDSDATRELAYRRSLRAARVRRATARLRRRRLSRGRRSMLFATVGVLLACGGAVAQKSVSIGAGLGTEAIAAAQRALGVAADGVVGPRTRAATKRFQRRHGLTVDGVIGPQTLKALGVENIEVRRARLRGAPAAASDPRLRRIAACESGGDPTAVSADGQYRGKYQFSLQTWRDVGGTGDPAQASEAEQDRMAAKLLRRAGTSPWPNCA